MAEKEYIEREALPQKKERGFFVEDDFNAGWNACLDAIASIPAADVVEVRHGRWIPGKEVAREYYGDCPVRIFYDKWTCSECGYVIDDHKYSAINYKFCPNCWADMREKN